jgi:hypothetical protein
MLRLTTSGKTDANGKFDWTDAVCDAGITSAITFFTTLGGAGVASSNWRVGLVTATISAATQFFVFLAIKRGLVQK